MKKLAYIMAVLAGFFLLGSCSYDDTLVREEIGKVEAELSEYEQKMADLESQLSSVETLLPDELSECHFTFVHESSFLRL